MTKPIKNIVCRACPEQFIGKEPLCDWCQDTGLMTGDNDCPWVCSRCELGLIERMIIDQWLSNEDKDAITHTAAGYLAQMPVLDGKLQAPFFHFEQGTSVSDVRHWLEHGEMINFLMQPKMITQTELNEELISAIELAIDFARRGPGRVIGYDAGSEREKDFLRGWNGAKEQIWVALEPVRIALAKLQSAADIQSAADNSGE